MHARTALPFLLLALASPLTHGAEALALQAAQVKALGIVTQAVGSGDESRPGTLPARVLVPNEQMRIVAAPVGGMIEMLAVARLCESRLHMEKPLAAWAIAGSLTFWSLGSTPSLLVVIASATGAVIYAMGGVGLLAASRRSRLQRLTGLIYLGFCPILLLRSYLAPTDNIGVMTSHMIQSIIYVTQFSLLLVGTVGFLLLMKESDDQLLRESEQRERQRRMLQSNFIDMLTHELRAALGKEWADRLVLGGKQGKGTFWAQETGPDGVVREFGSRPRDRRRNVER